MDISQWSMLQWALLIVVLLLINSIQSHKKHSFAFIVTVLILCFLASERTTVGDTRAYINGYFLQAAGSIEELSERIALNPIRAGFFSLHFLLRMLIGTNARLYLLIMAILIIYPILLRASEYTYDFAMVVCIFILSGMYITALNGMRQYLVTALFVLILPWIEEKKMIRAVVYVLLLTTIHQSAFILIPFIFIPVDNPWGRTTKFLLGSGIVLFIIYPLISPIVAGLLSDSAEYGQYSEIIISQSNGANIIRSVVKFVPIVLSYIKREDLQKYNFFGILLNGAILDFEFMLLASAQSWIIARFCMYFSFFSLALLVLSLDEFRTNRQIVKMGCYCAYFVFFFYDMLSMGFV